MRQTILALAAAAVLGLGLASPAFAEKVQIDPAANQVYDPNVVSLLATQPGLGAAPDTASVPVVTPPCTPYHLATAASTNSTSLKSTPGTLCGGVAMNTTATVCFLRVYNLATAPTASSGAGAVFSIPIPSSTTGAGVILNFGTSGANFTTGIGFVVTGGGGDTDNTSCVTGLYLNLTYK